MRDLASRLRAIVKQPIRSGSRPDPGGRELTYVPDFAGAPMDVDQAAASLGGVRHEVDGSACVVIERSWHPDEWHGRRRVEAYALAADAPIGLLDPRLTLGANWTDGVVFFDIETTGLSGGAGTLPLLVGCGWFENGTFKVRQFFLSGPAGERALLSALAEIFDQASLLVTYNGRTFDVPVMETRWAFHRRGNGAEDLAHFDMLPVARRLWGGLRGRDDDARPSCTLTSLERSVLRFHRHDDVPGLEIPSRYFQFLRTGDPGVITGVLEHNRHDILSLAAITAHALRLAADGPDACEVATEQMGLGRLYERAGELARAEHAYARAAAGEDTDLAVHALARLAVLLRRQSRYQEAADAWHGVLSLSSERSLFAALERQAAEALAIHHEHRARDLGAARRFAETVRRHAGGSRAAQAERRMSRLEGKIKRAGNLLE
jgi:uncharacterized protein YprB with RNaseH-like and TPR domain